MSESNGAAPSFYSALFDSVKEVAEAAAVEGVDEEIALLRAELRRHLRERDGDFDALVLLMPLILRALGLRYRISPQRAQDFAEQAAAVIKSLTEQFRAPDEE